MLLELVRSFFYKKKNRRLNSDQLNGLLDKAGECIAAGDSHQALKWFKEAHELAPTNVDVLNGLGACLADVGQESEAAQYFDIAYSLDDTHFMVLLNRARVLLQGGQTAEALEMLKRVKVVAPYSKDIASVYGAYCTAVGEAEAMVVSHKKSWTSNFDRLRWANSYLFQLSYSRRAEDVIAQEHQFWAETQRPSSVVIHPVNPDFGVGRRIRIGYWSPDLRSHSVRYFFRPLLTHHDRTRFEIHVYHDGPLSDDQTELIKQDAEHFHVTFGMSDQALCDLMHEHDLDVLVELAGHSSYNRISLLQDRLARVQVTALGYPPTTGLKSIDAKIIDRHVLTEDAASFYTELPFALPTSFWCYDPMEATPHVSPTPALEAGYITFGCVGNICKIADDVVRAWLRILNQVPNSRLLLRSISFRDEAVLTKYRQRLVGLGLPEDRLMLKPPEGGSGFFDSYKEIDVILDTFPFNGGTTTCFATYMGVPVVTMAGRSLLSRMGKSIMTNLGYPELVVEDLDSYVQAAVDFVRDPARLNEIRLGLRQRFKSTSLGDGKAYAREFEQGCLDLIELKKKGYVHQSAVPLLAERELVSRAYKVMGSGAEEAADRLIAYLTQHFPASAAVKILAAQRKALTDVGEAIELLTEALSDMSGNPRSEALITLVGWHLHRHDIAAASVLMGELERSSVENRIDQLNVKLLSAVVRGYQSGSSCGNHLLGAEPCKVLIGLIAEAPAAYRARVEALQKVLQTPTHVEVHFEHIDAHARAEAYAQLSQRISIDVVVLLHAHVDVVAPDFLQRALATLHERDLVSFAGCTRWQRLDWMTDAFDTKVGAWMTGRLSEHGALDGVDVSVWGDGADSVEKTFAVLHGSVLIARPQWLTQAHGFSEDLVASGGLFEGYLSYRAHLAGARLGVCQGLGLVVGAEKISDVVAMTEAKLALTKELDIDLFAEDPPDAAQIMASAPSVATGVVALDIYRGMHA